MKGREQYQCVPITEIPMCAQMKYQNAAFPNFKQQYSPSEANSELEDYAQLINSRCSHALIYLLCSVYAPFCYKNIEKNVLKTKSLSPCRNLCEHVSQECSDVVKENGKVWPPGPHLNCSNYPEYGKLCFGPKDPSTLTAIDGITTTEKPFKCEVEAGTTRADITLASGYNVSMATSIVCNPMVSNQTRSGVGHMITMRGLVPGTGYNCTVQQNKSSSGERKTCRLQFTTQLPLELQLINETPNVHESTIRLDFQTNRPTSTMQCQLLPTATLNTINKNCSNGTVEFVGVPPDHHTIRILAENDNEDRTTLRVRVRVPESPTHCGVNLINQQWVQDNNQITVWFKSLGPVESVQCRVDGETQACTSPYTVKNLSKGETKIRLIPKGTKCSKKSPRTFTIVV